MKLFRTSEIKEIERLSMQREGITSIELMQRAAYKIAERLIQRWDKTTPFVVFAGPGNNGGDALAIALILTREGYNTKTYLICPSQELSPECSHMREMLSNEAQTELYDVINSFTPPTLTSRTVIVDGLFGSGINRPLEGGFAAIVKHINNSPSYVVSIDTPSGLYGENNSGNNGEAIIKADWTLTFQFPKLSFLMRENESFVGEVEIIDLELDSEVISELHSPYQIVEAEQAASILKERSRFAHKGEFGHALLIAGSVGMVGAAQLAAGSALRSGVGLLTVHTTRSANLILQTATPEAIFSPDPSLFCFSEIPSLDRYKAIAIGPGIGQSDESAAALTSFMQRRTPNTVLDADALNLLAKNKHLLNSLTHGTILTPHPKEFDRIFGESASSYNRLDKALKLTKQLRIIIILKGAYTATVLPTGDVYFNPTGNPGMATGGSGDVLTGILVSLLAQGYNPVASSILGCYIHGLAGDLAAKELTQYGMKAGDLISFLPKAFGELVQLKSKGH